MNGSILGWRISVLCAMTLAACPASAGSLLRYGFDETLEPSIDNAHLDVGAFNLGSGVTGMGYSALNVAGTHSLLFNNRGFNNTDESGAVAHNRYLGFTVTPSEGFQGHYSALRFHVLRRESDGPYAPDSFSLRSSRDGFSSVVGSGAIGLSDAWVEFSVDLSGHPSFQSVTESTEFRLYFWASGGIGSEPSLRGWRVDEVELTGEIEWMPAPPVEVLAAYGFNGNPEPTLLPDHMTASVMAIGNTNTLSSWSYSNLRIEGSQSLLSSGQGFFNTNESSAISAGRYFHFTLEPDDGKWASYHQLSFYTLREEGHVGAPDSFSVRTSQDHFSSAAGAGIETIVIGEEWIKQTVDLSGVVALRNVEGPTEFRIYFWVNDGNIGSPGQRTFRMDDLQVEGMLAPIPTPVIESFSVGNVPGDYESGTGLGMTVQRSVLEGNQGFRADRPWISDSDDIHPTDAADLDHLLLSGSARPGAVRVTPSVDSLDLAYRPLALSASAGRHLISALIQVDDLDALRPGDAVALGLGRLPAHGIWSIEEGIYVGLLRAGDAETYLAVFAGGEMFPLGAPLRVHDVGRAHLVAAQLEADWDNIDRLTAWTARSDSRELNRWLTGVPVDAWSGPHSVDTFVVQSLGGVSPGDRSGVIMDEFRYGFDLADVLKPAEASRLFSLHVDPLNGDDDQAGSAAKPWASLERARAGVRSLSGLADGDLVVELAPGTYRLSEPVVFSEADSGTENGRVIYRSRDGIGAARLRGSEILTGWVPHEYGIWRVAIEPGWVFHTLYEDGKRAQKARWPSYAHDPAYPTARGPYLLSEAGSDESNTESTSWLRYRAGDVNPTGLEPGSLKISVFPWGYRDWHRWTCSVTALNAATRTITFDNLGQTTEIEDEARYFLEDHLSFLTDPGEFFLDQSGQMLYYRPHGEGHPDVLNISAPRTRDLLRLQGHPDRGPVAFITFEGLDLGETDAISPSLHWWINQWGMTDHALAWLNLAEHIHFLNCRFINSGRHGVLMAGGNLNHRVEGCLVEHMGITGLKISNRLSTGPGQGNAYPSGHHVLTNNRIRDVGELGLYAASIGMHSTSFNEVSYSDLYNSPRYAITLRGNTSSQHSDPGTTGFPPATDNHFHHLRIYECGHDSGDMGALHAAGVNIEDGTSINTFEQISIDKVRAVPGMQDMAPNGIFLDWPLRSMHQVFRNIHVVDTQGPAYRAHGRQDPVFENVSWEAGFDVEAMSGELGVRADFPPEFGGHTVGAIIHGQRETIFPLNHVDLEAKVVFAPNHYMVGDPVFAWSLRSGPGSVDWTAPSEAATTLLMPQPGQYEVEVQVSLNGATGYGTALIRYEPYPMPESRLSFAAWAAHELLPETGQGFWDDPFETGRPNVVAYATGLDPRAGHPVTLQIRMLDGIPTIILPWRMDIEPNIYFKVLTSGELSSWRTEPMMWQSIPLGDGRVEWHGHLLESGPSAKKFFGAWFGMGD